MNKPNFNPCPYCEGGGGMFIGKDYIICSGFCENCVGLTRMRNYPDVCTICDNDISDPKCLKRSAYERIYGAIDVINAAIREEGRFPHDD